MMQRHVCTERHILHIVLNAEWIHSTSQAISSHLPNCSDFVFFHSVPFLNDQAFPFYGLWGCFCIFLQNTENLKQKTAATFHIPDFATVKKIGLIGFFRVQVFNILKIKKIEKKIEIFPDIWSWFYNILLQNPVAWEYSKKNRTFPCTISKVRPRTCFYHAKRTPGKMCRHNPTGYISPVIEANNLFYLADFRDICWNICGCQTALPQNGTNVS